MFNVLSIFLFHRIVVLNRPVLRYFVSSSKSPLLLSIHLRVLRLSPCGRDYNYSTKGFWKMEASNYFNFINVIAHVSPWYYLRK